MKITKKLFKMLAIILCISMITPLISSSTTVIEAATKVKLNKTELTMSKGEIYQLKVSGTKKKPIWKSSNKKIAIVTSYGKVLGRRTGKTIITAKIGSKKYNCKVSVIEPQINMKNITLKVGNTYQLSVKNTLKIPEWKSTDTNIATVSSNGLVTAKKAGVTSVVAMVGNREYSCKIIVSTTTTSNNGNIYNSNQNNNSIVVPPVQPTNPIYINAERYNIGICEGENLSITIKSNCNHLVQMSNDNSIATASLLSNSESYYTLTITGIDSGTTFIKLMDNYVSPSIEKTITVNVFYKPNNNENIDNNGTIDSNNNSDSNTNSQNEEFDRPIIDGMSDLEYKIKEERYREEVEKLSNNMLTLQKQIAPLEGTTDRTALTKLLKLQKELAKTEKELKELQYDHSIDMQIRTFENIIKNSPSKEAVEDAVQRRKELIKEKKLHKIEIRIEEKKEEIAVLEKQIAAIASNTDTASKVMKIKKEAELHNRKKELESLETEYRLEKLYS